MFIHSPKTGQKWIFRLEIIGKGKKIHLHLDKDIEAKLSIVTVYFLDYKLF